MKEKKLPPKQELFCKEYIVDLNATQAALRADYSEKTAGSIGHNLLKKVEIQHRINELKQTRSQKTEITAERVLNELAKIAFADVTEFFEHDKKDGYVTLKKNFLNSPNIGAVAGIEPTATGLKVKMNDKQKALEMLMRHLGQFNADTSQKSEMNNFDLTEIPEDKLRKLQKVWNDSNEKGN